MINDDYALCAATIALDKRENLLDDLEYQHEDTFISMLAIFDKELKEVENREDIYDDLLFEIGCHIDRYSFKIDKYDVLESIFKEFDIKSAS